MARPDATGAPKPKPKDGVLPGTPAGTPAKGPGIVPGTPDDTREEGSRPPRRS
jgi:hypothetical protein